MLILQFCIYQILQDLRIFGSLQTQRAQLDWISLFVHSKMCNWNARIGLSLFVHSNAYAYVSICSHFSSVRVGSPSRSTWDVNSVYMIVWRFVAISSVRTNGLKSFARNDLGSRLSGGPDLNSLCIAWNPEVSATTEASVIHSCKATIRHVVLWDGIIVWFINQKWWSDELVDDLFGKFSR